ncbi:E3 ubiquitin-protein ligase UBR2 [Tupaia chinensis]|uniref:E3 ubiquitin-protein ligase n=1 Tax=Tupaia chinensis TaxID=246437 RepID=L9KUA5_TUPCH|nr:E3 ubiquitin-protein ligase UBR2 [Tupaia chinensis]
MASELEPEVQAVDRSLLECSVEETAGTNQARKVAHLHHCFSKGIDLILRKDHLRFMQDEDRVDTGKLGNGGRGADWPGASHQTNQARKVAHLHHCFSKGIDLILRKDHLHFMQDEDWVDIGKLGNGGCGADWAGASHQDPLVHLSEDVIARTYNIFAIMFRYAVEILTWEKESELPTDLETAEKSDTYYCMLFNDEVHTYEQVIYTLQKAVNCTQKEAIGFATTVDRDNYQQLQRDFMEDDHERAVSVTALSVQFFTAPTLNYERLQSDYVTDDHDREFSIADLSVQIFTVPSLARMLITEENLMTIIIKTFMDHLRHRDAQGRFQFERYTALQAFKFRRVQSLILDLKYVLISKPTEWSDELRQKFLEGFDAFLELLKCMQIFSTPDYGKRFSSEITHKDVVQQNNTLIEEMLYLIIMLVGERFSPGVGQVDATDEIKREIIHQLSIKPMAHSELVKSLPEDENKETGMESVIEAVAHFNLVNILQSDVMLCIMGTVLRWAVEHNGYAWSESMLQRSSRDKDKAERKRKAEIARLRREKIMAQMSEMQRHFIDENKELFQQTLELDASTSAVLDSRNPYSESIKEMLTTFGTATYKVGLKVHPNEEDPRVPIMCWGSCAYTIQSIALVPNDSHEDLPCILDIDMFHLLVSLVLAFPALQCQDFSGSSLGTGDLHILHLVTVAHVVQILLTSCPEENVMDQENPTGEEELAVLALYKLLRQYTGRAVAAGGHGFSNCMREQRGGTLTAQVTPYLQLLRTFPINPAALPGTLQPRLGALMPVFGGFHCAVGREVMKGLTRHWTGSYPRESNKLIDLPEDYSSLINQASNFSCPKSGGDKSRAPTLCLVCGTLLCSQSYCCQTELEGEDVGACTAHTYSCGSGVGIFLRVRECQVLFLAGKTKGCFYSPPYLDDYGETDQGLRRGNPLHLCKERFKKIQKLWHQHSITEEIGHAQEANQTLVGIDWQHL